jgi:hypothetical protein
MQLLFIRPLAYDEFFRGEFRTSESCLENGQPLTEFSTNILADDRSGEADVGHNET